MKTTIFTQRKTNRYNSFRCLRAFFATAFIVFLTSSLCAQDVLVGLNSNGGVEGKGTIYSIKTDTKAFNVIKGFADYGALPIGSLVQAPDGYFYGMTPSGGTYDYGTLFRLTASGDITILKHFEYSTDGGSPNGSLIVGKDGALYGVTTVGGINYGGTIFRITTDGVFTVLRHLKATPDGSHPNGTLLQAADGYFYGMAYNGGTNGYGTIFKMSATGSSYTVLRHFNSTDGSYPYGNLIQATDGALYGMTCNGGTTGRGVIFKITTTGTYTILRNLNSATDGQYPYGSLLQAKDGYLYGLTYQGGSEYGGTIFKMNLSGTTFKVLKNLYSSTTGSNPQGHLIEAKDGYLYGMTYYSPYGPSSTAGEVFKISTAGSFTIVRKFTEATDGSYPRGSLVQGTDGYLYGMTQYGGKNLLGTAFKMTTSGTLTVLNHFNNDVNGTSPQDNLAIGKDSAYFGVTTTGGLYDNGTIFKTCGGVTTILRSFNRSADGGNPIGGLMRAKDGNLYGTTSYGGKNNAGTIFKITPTGTYTVIRHLTGTTDGAYPETILVEGADGLLYGTTPSGGTGGYGTIFKINLTGSTYTVLKSLTTNEGNSKSGLVLAKDGLFYGFVSGNGGTFFKISSAGVYTALHSFTYTTEGGAPEGTPVQGADGAFYGATTVGGTNYNGTIFKITSTGTVTVLRQIVSATDGKIIKGNLVQGSDGAFYGTASAGGTYNAGTIFKITTAKVFTVLRQLKMATDGGTPLGGLIISPKIVLVATPQAATTNEDVAKAITLAGTGATNLTYNIVTQPRSGSITSGTTAARTYTPRANFSGVDSFAFTANLGCLASAPAWVKITVASVNDAPVLASIGNKTVAAGTKLTFTATATDVDAGQTKTFSLITPPSGATIGSTTGMFSWTPATTGTYTVKVRVTDNGSPVLYDEETITVTVTSALTIATTQNAAFDGKQNEAQPAQAALYPNPVVSAFVINLKHETTNARLMIVDMKGATVYSKQYNGAMQQLQVNAAALKPGAYMALVQEGSHTETLKFIKQ